jgi:hypothetical protein
MSTIKYILILIVLVILLGVAFVFRSAFPSPGQSFPIHVIGVDTDTDPGTDDVVACTMDAMMCPDGTYVGRSGPNCEFVCSYPSSASAAGGTTLYEEFTVGLNESKTVGHTTIKPWAVTQDSRCPSDVVCVQAGKVTVAFSISSPAGDSIKEITTGDTMEINSLVFTLKAVNPYPISTNKTQDGEYRFAMEVRGK